MTFVLSWAAACARARVSGASNAYPKTATSTNAQPAAMPPSAAARPLCTSPILKIAENAITLGERQLENQPTGDRKRGIFILDALFEALVAPSGNCGGNQVPLSVIVEENAASSRLFGVLGIATLAGWPNAVIQYGDRSLRVHWNLQGERGATHLRAVRNRMSVVAFGETAHVPRSERRSHLGPAELIVDSLDTFTDSLSQNCSSKSSNQPSLSVTEDSPMSVWFPWAIRLQEKCEGSNATPLEIALDRGPRPEMPREPPRPKFVPVGRLAPEAVQQRVFAEYASIKSCIAPENHLNGEENLLILMPIGNDGLPKNVKAKSHPSNMSEAQIECVLEGFRRMSFPPPNPGIVTILYPVPL